MRASTSLFASSPESKILSKGDAQSLCLEYVHKMNIFLGSNYSNPIDIDLNQIVKNWAGFLKLYLKHLLKDWLALLRGEHAF